ncbi:MAG: hypothetical protein D6707_11645 [Bacteroidetes bacterium]|nr:MAG: hypothetical protein D6707_11645 [Bacteroidota bacterium]
MEKIKKFVPHIVAVLIFLIISAIYFYPAFQGKRLNASDIKNYKGMSKEIIDWREKTGEEALWTNRMFGGMPAYQISVKYKGNLMYYIDRLLQLGLPHPVNIMFLYCLGFYILLVSLKIDPKLAVVGAVAFAFSSYFIIILEAGHNTKAHAIAYMPPILGGVVLAFRKKYWLGAALTALFLALQLKANHLQITYYTAILVLVYVIYQTIQTIKDKDYPHLLKTAGFLSVALILAVSTNISALWTTYEYGKETIRGKSELTIVSEKNQTEGLDKDYATQWSYGVDETLTLLVPNFKGGASEPIAANEDLLKKVSPQNRQLMAYVYQYHGDQPFTSGPVYVGAIVFFLFVLGLFLIESRLKWAILIATLLSVMLAWGKNFMPLTDFFLEYVPGYNKFRAVSMTLVIAELTIPFLAILTLNEILKNPELLTQKRKQVYYALGLTGGITLLMAIFPSLFTDFVNNSSDVMIQQQLQQAGFPSNQIQAFFNEVEDVRESMLQKDAIRSLIFILLAFAALWMYEKKKIQQQAVVAIMGVLILADLWMVDKRYLNNKRDRRGQYISWIDKKQLREPYQPNEADLMILKDKDLNFRVYNTTVGITSDGRSPYFYNSIGGYHGAKLRRFQELIDFHISKGNMNVLNMLNTKYFIMQGQDGRPVVQQNPAALGNAWFVKQYKLVANADSELLALNDFNPAETAIVDKRFEEYVQGFVYHPDSTAYIKLTEYAPNHLTYEFEAKHDMFTVFSEIYYNDQKGWKAYVDGKQVPHFRVNYVLRAMIIPAGKHKVEFKFEPRSYYTGEKISLAGSLILLFFAALGIYKGIKEES